MKYQDIENVYFSVGGIKIHPVQIPDVVEIMTQWINEKVLGNYIVVSNANDAVLSNKDKSVKNAVNASSLSVPDGFSMVLLGRVFGYPLKNRVYGPDLMLEFLDQSQKSGFSHYFYGATDTINDLMIKNLRSKFPLLKIAGSFAPPFRQLSEDEKIRVIDSINYAGPDVLWIGLGCPKQQLWMHEFSDKLNVPVMVGVGAAFDFVAGTKSQAPKWMQKSGLEWFYRLATEPTRLWKRYLIGNTVFIWLCIKEIFKTKIRGKTSAV